jgi:hypothetical protein
MNDDITSLKELLNTKLDLTYKNLSEKIDSNNKNVMLELSFIKEQTTRTNGRVTKSESSIQQLFKNNLERHTTCPGLLDLKSKGVIMENRVNKLDEDNFIIKVINKYPKQIIILIAMAVLLTVSSAGYTMLKFQSAINDMKSVEQIIKQRDENNRFY